MLFAGILAGIVAFLVLVTVIIIVIIRNHKLSQNGFGQTHVSFSTDIDQQAAAVMTTSDEDVYTEKGMQQRSGREI